MTKRTPAHSNTPRNPIPSYPSAERFVTAWQHGASLSAVALALKMDIKTAASRAYAYRKRGIALKRFPRGKAPLNDKHLRELARSCQ